MNYDEKMERLKERYLNIVPTNIKQENWIKKVNIVFQEGHYMKNFSLEEQRIRDLERCLIFPRLFKRHLEAETLPEAEYNKLLSERYEKIRQRTKEVLEWFNNL